MYQLYSIAGSCSTGIHALLNQLQQPVEIIERDDVDDYSALVATNQVPALKNGDQLLTEGAAIVLQLLERHGSGSEANDGEFRQWLMFNYATLHPAYSKLFTVNSVMAEGEEKQALLQTLANRVAKLWQIVDQRLAQRETMYGTMLSDSLGIIDYLLAVYVRWGNAFPTLSIPVGENVLQLVDRVVELPAFAAAFEREGLAYTIPANAR